MTRVIYTASKTKYAPMWRLFKELGMNINSTWIYEAGVGESKSFSDLWIRCINEASQCDRLVLYALDQDPPLKGAFVECGAALAAGKELHAFVDVGLRQLSFFKHPQVRLYQPNEISIIKEEKWWL